MKIVRSQKRQLAIVIIIVIFFFMLLGLNSRLSDLFRLSNYRESMQAKVALLKGTDIALKTQIADAESDLAIEEWARDQAHLVLPGDQVIVPLSQDELKSPKTTQPAPTEIPVESWRVWWDLLFSK